MSYILDALRRADAERDRGSVPGIHAQPGYGAPAPASAPPVARPWPWLVAGALAVALVGGVAWYLLAGRPAVEAVPAMPAVAQAPVAPPPPVPAVPATVAAPPPVVAAPAPIVRRNPKPAATAPSGAEAKPTGTAEKVYTQSELPEDIRRQLPAFTVGGSMYSGKPADRLLILNGQVAHEGDKVANDVVLQQIRLKSAVLNFKGYRYTIDF